jgi:hypothetical protein
MKKSKPSLGTAVFLLLFVVMVVFTGCASTYVYSKDTPPEGQATLKLQGNYLTVVAMDEFKVKWKFGGIFKASTVTLPAGPHTFTVNYKQGSSLMAFYGMGTVKRAEALHVSGKFEPGHTYRLFGDGVSGQVQLSLTETEGGTK